MIFILYIIIFNRRYVMILRIQVSSTFIGALRIWARSCSPVVLRTVIDDVQPGKASVTNGRGRNYGMPLCPPLDDEDRPVLYCGSSSTAHRRHLVNADSRVPMSLLLSSKSLSSYTTSWKIHDRRSFFPCTFPAPLVIENSIVYPSWP